MPGQRQLDTYVQDPDEVKQYSVDYSKWLAAGETIVSVTTSVAAKGLVSPAVSPLLADDYQVNASGNGVTYRIEHGDDGETYDVFITITTSAGQVKQDLVIFKVRSLG
jgi:hypothetical protein